MRKLELGFGVTNIQDFLKELDYEIATARAKNEKILKIDILQDDSKLLKKLKNSLNSLKKQGRLSNLAWKDNFDSQDLIASYVVDKFPMIYEENHSNSHDFVFILL